MDAGIAMTLASSRFSSERVATMRRQPGGGQGLRVASPAVVDVLRLDGDAPESGTDEVDLLAGPGPVVQDAAEFHVAAGVASLEAS